MGYGLMRTHNESQYLNPQEWGVGGASPLMGKVSGLGMPPPSEIMPGMPTSGCSARIGDGFRLRLDLPGWGRARRRLRE